MHTDTLKDTYDLAELQGRKEGTGLTTPLPLPCSEVMIANGMIPKQVLFNICENVFFLYSHLNIKIKLTARVRLQKEIKTSHKHC